METLHQWGIPTFFINCIASMFLGVLVKTRLLDRTKTRVSNCGIGIPQGGAMRLILFNLSCTKRYQTLNADVTTVKIAAGKGSIVMYLLIIYKNMMMKH